MKCERSFKRALITYWGMTELQRGKPYDQVKLEMKKLNRLTLEEVKRARAAQKAKV
jgi:hypothetical protein